MALTTEQMRTRQVITQDEVLAMLGISAVTLKRWYERGKFPRPLPTVRKLLWNAAAVEKFLNGGSGDSK
jgi:predicted DNA-binding transcriptional regulator AlpA